MERQKPVELEGALKTVGSIGSVRYGILGAFEDQTRMRLEVSASSKKGPTTVWPEHCMRIRLRTAIIELWAFFLALTSHPDQETKAHGVDYHYLTAQGDWKVDGQFLFSSADERRDGFGGFVDIGRDFGKGRRLRIGYSHYDQDLNIND